MACARLVVFKEALRLEVGFNQRLASRLFAEVATLGLEYFRAELACNVSLAVGVKGHKLVHAEDVHLHIHLSTVDIALQLRVELMDIELLRQIVGGFVINRSGCIGNAVYLQNVELHLSLQQKSGHAVEAGCLCRFLAGGGILGCLHDVELHLNLAGLIYLAVYLYAVEHEVVGVVAFGELFAHTLFQQQRAELVVLLVYCVAESQPVDIQRFLVNSCSHSS